MERSFLEKFGLEKEQITEILNRASDDIGKKINEYQAKIDAEAQKTASVQQELDTANATINDLKKSNKDNESLQTQIEKYKTDIEQLKKDAENERVALHLDIALTQAGAINPKTVKPLIDMEKIVVGKDGTIAGIDEQIQAIVADEKNAFLFNRNEPANIPEPPDRGGYEPYAGTETPPEQSSSDNMIDNIIKEALDENQESTADNSGSFWDSLTTY